LSWSATTTTCNYFLLLCMLLNEQLCAHFCRDVNTGLMFDCAIRRHEFRLTSAHFRISFFFWHSWHHGGVIARFACSVNCCILLKNERASSACTRCGTAIALLYLSSHRSSCENASRASRVLTSSAEGRSPRPKFGRRIQDVHRGRSDPEGRMSVLFLPSSTNETMTATTETGGTPWLGTRNAPTSDCS
jgi:hypothetical protein